MALSVSKPPYSLMQGSLRDLIDGMREFGNHVLSQEEVAELQIPKELVAKYNNAIPITELLIQPTLEHYADAYCKDLPYGTKPGLIAGGYNEAYVALEQENGLLENVSEYLGQKGFRHFNLAGNGGYSLVLSTTEGQLVKVGVSKHSPQTIRSPEILEPLPFASQQFDIPHEAHQLTVDVYPEVRATEVTESHLCALEYSLAKKGLSFADMNPENVRILPDGTPIIIDAGAVKVAETPSEKRKVAEVLTLAPDPRYSWEDEQGAWKQHQFYSQTPQGVASDETLARIEAEHEDGASYTQIIRDKGLYARGLLAELGRAAEDFNAKQDGRPLSAHLAEKSIGKIQR